MSSKNDVTGDSLVSKHTSDAYRNNYDRIFRKWNDLVKEADGSVTSIIIESHSDTPCTDDHGIHNEPK